MVKAKKAAPKQDKTVVAGNVTKRKSFKRATSTPLSKGEASISVTASSTVLLAQDETLLSTKTAKAKNPKPAKKIQNVIETPKSTGTKRNASDESNSTDASPKKQLKTSFKRKETGVLGRSTSRVIKAPVLYTSSPFIKVPRIKRGKGKKTANDIVKHSSAKKAKKVSTPLKQRKSVLVKKPLKAKGATAKKKSLGVVAGKVARRSGAAPTKKGKGAK